MKLEVRNGKKPSNCKVSPEPAPMRHIRRFHKKALPAAINPMILLLTPTAKRTARSLFIRSMLTVASFNAKNDSDMRSEILYMGDPVSL